MDATALEANVLRECGKAPLDRKASVEDGNESDSAGRPISSPPHVGPSQNTSLGPEAVLLPGQVDWSQGPQLQGHRRSPSEYSEVSSVAPLLKAVVLGGAGAPGSQKSDARTEEAPSARENAQYKGRRTLTARANGGAGANLDVPPLGAWPKNSKTSATSEPDIDNLLPPASTQNGDTSFPWDGLRRRFDLNTSDAGSRGSRIRLYPASPDLAAGCEHRRLDMDTDDELDHFSLRAYPPPPLIEPLYSPYVPYGGAHPFQSRGDYHQPRITKPSRMSSGMGKHYSFSLEKMERKHREEMYSMRLRSQERLHESELRYNLALRRLAYEMERGNDTEAGRFGCLQERPCFPTCLSSRSAGRWASSEPIDAEPLALSDSTLEPVPWGFSGGEPPYSYDDYSTFPAQAAPKPEREGLKQSLDAQKSVFIGPASPSERKLSIGACGKCNSPSARLQKATRKKPEFGAIVPINAAVVGQFPRPGQQKTWPKDGSAALFCGLSPVLSPLSPLKETRSEDTDAGGSGPYCEHARPASPEPSWDLVKPPTHELETPPSEPSDAQRTTRETVERFCATHSQLGTSVRSGSGSSGGSTGCVTPQTEASQSTGIEPERSTHKPETKAPGSQRPPNKRPRMAAGGGTSSDDEGDEELPQPGDAGRSTKTQRERPEEILLACPFRKHNPLRYRLDTHRTCAAGHWGTMARVKEHVYRAHKLIVCIRCQHEFTSQKAFESHQRADIACERRPEMPHEGITPAQEKKLKSRKEAHRSKSPEDQWRSAYQILFPGEEPPSPYYEEFDGDAYHAFVGQELPARVADAIEPLLSGTCPPGQVCTKLALNDISNVVKECLKSVSHSFRAAPTAAGERRRAGTSTQAPFPPEPDLDVQIAAVLTAGPIRLEAAQIPVLGVPDLSGPGSDTAQGTESAVLAFSFLAHDPLHVEDLDGTDCFCVSSCNGSCHKWDFSPEAWGMGSKEI